MADINVQMGVTGVAQFKSNIKNAQSAVKALDAEMKLADANFRATGDAQEYAAKKSEILQRQIEEQKKVVDETKKAMEMLEKDGIDKSSDAYQKWAEKLANAQARLVGMQASLNTNTSGLQKQEKALEEAGKEAGEYKESLNSIDKQVSFETVIRGLENITSAVENGIKKIGEMGQKLWNFELEATNWADDLLTEARNYDLDPEKLQRMDYAARFIDVETDTILKARAKISAAVSKMDENGMIELFSFGDETFSTNIRNSMGVIKTTEQLFWEAVGAIESLGNETLQNAAAESLFSRRYTELKGLFQPGAQQEYERMMAEAPVVSAEYAQKLGEANDAWQKLDAQWQVLKMDVAGGLAEGFKTISESLTTVVKSLDDFAKSETGQAALKNFADSIAAIITNFADPGTLESAIGTVTSAVKGLNEGLEWIANNGGTVTSMLKGLAIAFGVLKIATVGLKIAEFVTGLKGLGGAAGAATAAADAASSAQSAAASAASAASASAEHAGAEAAAAVAKAAAARAEAAAAASGLGSAGTGFLLGSAGANAGRLLGGGSGPLLLGSGGQMLNLLAGGAGTAGGKLVLDSLTVSSASILGGLSVLGAATFAAVYWWDNGGKQQVFNAAKDAGERAAENRRENPDSLDAKVTNFFMNLNKTLFGDPVDRMMNASKPKTTEETQTETVIRVDMAETEAQVEEQTQEVQTLLEEASEAAGASAGTKLTGAYAQFIESTMGAVSEALDALNSIVMSKINYAMSAIASLQEIANGGSVNVKKNYTNTTNLNVQTMNMSTRYDADTFLQMLTDQQRRMIQGVGGP